MTARVEKKLVVEDPGGDTLTIEPVKIEEHEEVVAALNFGGQTFWLVPSDLDRIVEFVDGIEA